MSSEERLIECWRGLTQKERSEVVDFVELLHQRKDNDRPNRTLTTKTSTTSLQRHRLLELRQQIVDSGPPLLNGTELEAEIANRRGGIELHQ